MTPDAGSANFGGRKEHAGTKGYSADDLPLRDGHNEEPDVPTVLGAADPGDTAELDPLDEDDEQ